MPQLQGQPDLMNEVEAIVSRSQAQFAAASDRELSNLVSTLEEYICNINAERERRHREQSGDGDA
jgi:hypothetical protein